jgi:RNA-directed DNA polymerase
MSRMREPRSQGKSYDIPKMLVWDAWLKVKENGGAAGPDGVTIQQFEGNLIGNLYKLWNRMSSGSYLPGPVRMVEIPKPGGTRIWLFAVEREFGFHGCLVTPRLRRCAT